MISELFLKDISLWGCVWQSTLFAVIGLAGSFLLRRRPARASQVLFLAMVAAVLVPTMSVLVKHFELGVFVAEPIARQLETRDMSSATLYGASAVLPTPESQPQAHEGVTDFEGSSGGANIPWRTIVLYGWMIATLILLGRLLAAFVSGVLLLRRAQSQGCEQIQQAADSARARLGITKGLRVRSSKDISSPVIWCWSPIPVLLVPGDLNHRIDWVGVICHELAHWKRWDHVIGLIAELIVCILSWNPLLWWSKKRIVRLSEQACDDWVVAGGRPCEDYAQSLLNFKPQKQVAFVPAVVHSKRGLAGRVRRILIDSCSDPRAGAVWALAVSIVAACLAIGVACAQTRPAKPDAATEHDAKYTEALIKAAADGDIEQVRVHISSGADVNVKDKYTQTPLHIAAGRGHAEIVALLITKGADVNTKDNTGRTPLYLAASSGHSDVARILLTKGADPNVSDEHTQLPLHLAARYGHSDVVELLLAKGTDIEAKTRGADLTPLYYAACYGHKDVAELLIAKGADVNGKTKWGTPLHIATRCNRKDMVELLLAKGADINTKGYKSATTLNWAAFFGRTEMAEMLIAKGADIHAKDERGWTPLHYAARGGHKQLAEMVMAKGLNVNAKSKYGETPLDVAAMRGPDEVSGLLIAKGAKVDSLHCAAYIGDLAKVKSLIEEGADVDTKNSEDGTPLYAAAAGGQRNVADLLIRKGADMNAKNKEGLTPLHIAATAGHRNVAELLLAKDVDVDGGSKNWTPLQCAAMAGHEDVSQLLLDRGAEVNVSDPAGYTPLHLAAEDGYKEVAELLIARGANINAKESLGATPLHYAALKGHRNVAELLIANGADVNAKTKRAESVLNWVMKDNDEVAALLRKHGAKE